MAECINFKVGKEFLKKHNWPIALSNAVHNRCYCSNCYSAELKDTLVVGGHTYVVPRDWTRFGICMNDGIAEHLDVWNSWANCFHGTSIENAKSIVENQMLLMPGEVTMDGKKIEILPGHISNEYFFFTTPTIKYAAHGAYAKRYSFESMNGKKYKIKVVLQCKQKPDSFIVQPETVGAYSRICPYIPNEMMEWKTTQRASILPYGMLLYIKHKGSEEGIRQIIPLTTSQQIDCPHCWESNVWNKSNQGVVQTCVHKTCKKKFQPFNCPHCSCLHVKRDHEGISVCSNDHCQRQILQSKCKRCSGLNVWKIPDKKQALTVTCSYKNCWGQFQLYNCPHCDSTLVSSNVTYKKGRVVKCCESFQLVDCPHCWSLNVLKKVGHGSIVKCAYKRCSKNFPVLAP